jgi:hypothetical protein
MSHRLFAPVLACLLGTALVPLQGLAQSRPDLMFCGSSSRTGANLYSGITALNEVSSCTPDANTQALLITRSGIGSIGGSGAALLAYMDAGGIIITEYTASDDVYNELYGTSYSLSAGGNCQDNVQPSQVLNPADPFWQGSPPAPLGDNSLDGCGLDLQPLVDGEASVTALGTREPEGTTSLAYRTQGNGLLILADQDWQDTNAGYTDGSRALFGRFITASLSPAGPAEPVPTMPFALLGLLVAAVGGLGWRGSRRS